MHAAALRALDAHDGAPLPVTVKIVVEGEEECSTEHLPDLVRGHGDLLTADVAIIADGGNYRTGVPTIGTSVRGVTDCRVTVSVLPIAQHSGAYGGPIPDAITALSRMIATLHDDDGNVAIRGAAQLRRGTGMQVTEDEFRRGVQGLRLGPHDRFGHDRRPAAVEARRERARVRCAAASPAPRTRSCRPRARGCRSGSRPATIRSPAAMPSSPTSATAAPWGVRVEIEADEAGQGYLVDTDAPTPSRRCRDALAEAFEADVVEIGSGGSIPLVPMLAETFPGMAVLIIGAGDERSNYHSIDESVDLGDLERLALAEALLIRNLGG